MHFHNIKGFIYGNVCSIIVLAYIKIRNEIIKIDLEFKTGSHIYPAIGSNDIRISTMNNEKRCRTLELNYGREVPNRKNPHISGSLVEKSSTVCNFDAIHQSPVLPCTCTSCTSMCGAFDYIWLCGY